MKRFLLLASFVICSLGLNASSESSQEVERSTKVAAGTSYDLLHKFRIISSTTYPCIAGKSMSCTHAASPFVYSSISAACFLVGHDDQSLSEAILQQCEIKSHKLRYLEVPKYFDKIKKKFMSSPLIEESAKNKLFLAAIRCHLTFKGVKKISQCIVHYEAYDVRTNELIKGQCDLSKNPSFSIFDSEKVQAYDESTELFERYLAKHDVVGFSFCPAELSRFFVERYAVSLERSRLGRSHTI